MSNISSRKLWIFCFVFALLGVSSCSEERMTLQEFHLLGEDVISQTEEPIMLIAIPSKQSVQIGEEFWVTVVVINTGDKEQHFEGSPGRPIVLHVTGPKGNEYDNSTGGSGGGRLLSAKSFIAWRIRASSSCTNEKGQLAFKEPGKYRIRGIIAAGEGKIVNQEILVPTVSSNYVTIEVVH